MEPFLSVRDARMRLHDTIGLYRGIPVHIKVDERDPVNTIIICKLGSPNRHYSKISCTNPELELHEFNMGYCNHGNQTSFWERLPTRNQQQGITNNNTYCNGERVAVRSMQSNAFTEMLQNKYPTYAEAFSDVYEQTVTSRAFTKAFAIDRLDDHNVVLRHNTRIIAMYDEDQDAWQFLAGTGQIQSFYVEDLAPLGLVFL